MNILPRRKNALSDNSPSDLGSYAHEADKLELLSAMDILQDLPPDQIEALMDQTPMRTAVKGTTLFGAEGAEVLFLLKSGQVELYRQSSDGRKLTLAIVEKNTFFGEMSLVDLHLEGTYAAAREDCVVCILSRHDLENLMLEYPTVAIRVIEVVTQRLQQTRSFLQEMAFNDLTGKVANLLLRLADPKTNLIEGHSHEELATMVGCLRESFTVVLDRFKQSNTVATGRRQIEITDREQLLRVVEQRM